MAIHQRCRGRSSTLALTQLFVVLTLIGVELMTTSQAPAQVPIDLPKVPDVNKVLRDLEKTIPRIKPQPPQEEPRAKPEQPAERSPERAPSPQPTVSNPLTPQPPKPARKPRHPPVPQQDEMLLVDTPVATVSGGNSVMFSPAGDLLLTVTSNGTAKLWDTETWQERQSAAPLRIQQYSGDLGFVRRACGFSPDGTLLAFTEGGDQEGMLFLVKVQETPISLFNRVPISNHNCSHCWNGVAWSQDGNCLVTRSANGGLALWGKKGLLGQVRVVVAGFATGDLGVRDGGSQWTWANDLALAPDGTFLAVLTQQAIKIYSVPQGEEVKSLPVPGEFGPWKYLPFFGLSPDGKTLAATLKRKASEETKWQDDVTVKLWDTTEWRERSTIRSLYDDVNFKFSGFSPDNKYVVTTSGSTFDNVVSVWDAASGASVQAFRTQNCRNTLFASKGRILVTGGNVDSRRGDGSNINCWDAVTGLLRLRVVAEKVYCIAISPNNPFLVAGNMDSQAQVFDLRRSRKVPCVPERFDE